jgi:hypothetical protein
MRVGSTAKQHPFPDAMHAHSMTSTKTTFARGHSELTIGALPPLAKREVTSAPTCCCCLRYTIGFPPSVSRLAAVILPLSLYTLIMYIATLRSAAVSPSPLVGACMAGGGPGGGLGACTAGKGGHSRGGCCARGGVRAKSPALAGCGGPGGDPAGGLTLRCLSSALPSKARVAAGPGVLVVGRASCVWRLCG